MWSCCTRSLSEGSLFPLFRSPFLLHSRVSLVFVVFMVVFCGVCGWFFGACFSGVFLGTYNNNKPCCCHVSIVNIDRFLIIECAEFTLFEVPFDFGHSLSLAFASRLLVLFHTLDCFGFLGLLHCPFHSFFRL